MSAELIELRPDLDPAARDTLGTQYGSRSAMPSPTPRQRDRRLALAELLAALTRALDRRNDISLIRGVFEESLRRVVPVQTVQLRDAGSRWLARLDGTAGPES